MPTDLEIVKRLAVEVMGWQITVLDGVDWRMKVSRTRGMDSDSQDHITYTTSLSDDAGGWWPLTNAAQALELAEKAMDTGAGYYLSVRLQAELWTVIAEANQSGQPCGQWTAGHGLFARALTMAIYMSLPDTEEGDHGEV